MAKKKIIKVHNKYSKPDNIVQKEHTMQKKCQEIELELPMFMNDFFIFLKNAVAPSSRLAYLKDIHFFCRYICTETNLTKADKTSDISVDDFNNMKARDINRYLGDYCTQYFVETESITYEMCIRDRNVRMSL